MEIKTLKGKIKDFWLRYEYKIVLVLGFFLVAIISFEGGILQGRKMLQNPIIIEKPAENTANQAAASQNAPEAQNSIQEAKNTVSSSDIVPQNCAFVGSKNSDKYHLPSCRYAKNINEANRVCFSSAEDAAAKGYQPDKNCIK
jgi:hypothetical protein